MAKTYDEDDPVSDEVATAIGHLVVQWGHLEDNAIVLAAVILGANHYDFRAAGVNIPTRAKFETLESVARAKLKPKGAERIAAIAQSAISLTGERNRVMHGSWYPTKRTPVARRYVYTARGALNQKTESVSAARIAGFTAEVAKVRRRLNDELKRRRFYKRDS